MTARCLTLGSAFSACLLLATPGSAAEMTGTSFPLSATWQAWQRATDLAARIQSMPGAADLSVFEEKLAVLKKSLEAAENPSETPAQQRQDLYLQTRGLARQIAFQNPRLRQIERLLFITRRDSRGVFHMVDQFYGFNGEPGGELLVLSQPFGKEPKAQPLLQTARVERGRLAGRKLEDGSFLSPEVSFDGQTILFAWSEGFGQDLEWSTSSSYHIFKVNADGTGLVQLTDGSWNDFDPCFLPNGRIAFVSERRGGFLRCGRHCPTYTLFGMAADGSDALCLSFHETHEWQPSVTHDGRLIYTRWDYVDRDTNLAHHPWTCRPDGSDPRAVHGNYPQRREDRPWMEMDLRAIPGSHKFVATAAAHHGHAFGSLVIIDPHVEDDGAMAPLSRLTPDVPFPEAEQNVRPIRDCMVYGTAWPLSEDDYLCVYGPAGTARGIYWIDRFGNREHVYSDPALSCLSPMPLQARPRPPVLSEFAGDGLDGRGAQPSSDMATVAVMNVYDSDFPWPADAKISSLRIMQLLPKTTPAPNEPRIGTAEQSNARAVLGSVPVEEDGSAYFEAPSGKALYFQAVDEQGLAVQSMRSVTYLHPGERLFCQGCHEPKHRAPVRQTTVPLALRRAPSRILPDAEGSNPFSFVRLVQPVLDRACVNCHRDAQALDLTGMIEGKDRFTKSYLNLAPQYGFYFHVFNGAIHSGAHGGARTVAGQFGARASRLMAYLNEAHYDVKLPQEDWHRITLWLDSNSEFFGAYERIEDQARGERVEPALE